MLKKNILLAGVFCSLMLNCVNISAMEKKNTDESNNSININNINKNDDNLNIISELNIEKTEEETPTGETDEEIKKVMDKLTRIEKSLFGKDRIDYCEMENEEKKKEQLLLDTTMKDLISLEKYIKDNKLEDILKKGHDRKVLFRINWQKEKINKIRTSISFAYLNYVKNHSGTGFGKIPYIIIEKFREKENDISSCYEFIKKELKNDPTYSKSQQGIKELKNLSNKIKELKNDHRYIFAGDFIVRDGKCLRDRINEIENEINVLAANQNI